MAKSFLQHRGLRPYGRNWWNQRERRLRAWLPSTPGAWDLCLLERGPLPPALKPRRTRPQQIAQVLS